MTPSEEAKRLLDTGEGALRRVATEGHTWTVFPKEAGAIVAEIDRLRAESATWKRIAEEQVRATWARTDEERGKESDPRLYGHVVGGPPPTPVLGMGVAWRDHGGGEWMGLVGCTPYTYPQRLLRVYAPWGGPLLWSAE